MFKIPIPLKAIPMVLDDSFTPAELLTKITFKINEIIEATNTLQTDKVDIYQGVEKAGYFLKVDREGKVVAIESGGVMANWGDIGGEIANQEDLINYLNTNYVEKSTYNTAIGNLQSAVNTINTIIGTWTSALGADIATAIGNLQNAVNTINTTIGTWTSALGTNIATAIGNLQNAVNTINTTIGTWTSALGTNIATAIGNLQNAVNTINTTIGNDIITGIGTSITNALVNIDNKLNTYNIDITEQCQINSSLYRIYGDRFKANRNGNVICMQGHFFGVELSTKIPQGKLLTLPQNITIPIIETLVGFITYNNGSIKQYIDIYVNTNGELMVSREITDANNIGLVISINILV